jgi:peroxiredoxin
VRKIAIVIGLAVAIMASVSGCAKDSESDIGSKIGSFMGSKDDTQVSEEKYDNSGEEVAEVGKPAPKFTAKSLGGRDVGLEDYKGKYVVINFWATWCKFCVVEMPDLEKFARDNEDFAVLAISSGESKAAVEKFIKDNGYDLNVLLDEDGSISGKYGITGFPTSIYLDKEGNVQGVNVGMMSAESMNKYRDYMRSTFK